MPLQSDIKHKITKNNIEKYISKFDTLEDLRFQIRLIQKKIYDDKS